MTGYRTVWAGTAAVVAVAVAMIAGIHSLPELITPIKAPPLAWRSRQKSRPAGLPRNATAGDPARTGNVLEAMAAASADTLSPAYYDVCLTGKYIRDDESEGMLDLIFSTRNFDIGITFNWGGALNIFTGMYSTKQNTFASDCAAKESAILKSIDEFVKTIA